MNEAADFQSVIIDYLASLVPFPTACQHDGDMAKAMALTLDPVKLRVAPPAADPPDTQE